MSLGATANTCIVVCTSTNADAYGNEERSVSASVSRRFSVGVRMGASVSVSARSCLSASVTACNGLNMKVDLIVCLSVSLKVVLIV